LFGLLVPLLVTTKPFRDAIPSNKPMTLVGAPNPGTKVIFNILLAPPDATEKLVKLMPHEYPIEIIGHITLKTGTAWLLWFYVDSPKLESEEIKKHFDGIRVHLRPGASGENIKTISAHIVEEGPTGPFLIDIQLGEENLTHKESK